jgi:hypothetical protein
MTGSELSRFVEERIEPLRRKLRRLYPGDPVQCMECGFTCERRELADFLVRTSRGRTWPSWPPERCSPDEFAVECPECRARESFVDAIRCWECGGNPCLCHARGA